MATERVVEPATDRSIVDVRIELERMREGIPRICSTDKERADYKSSIFEAATVRSIVDEGICSTVKERDEQSLKRRVTKGRDEQSL